ncbi:hypothetical protein [Lentilactobacillus hilgardii]|uniref:hypothetical protein n=1 Tax=Lentilactobacillus hilgardii TaxID=1588 RepID=UPI00058C6BC2|nr:hypothetical protein [Lentilactobacillus hilgardii]QEU39600.1 hypothetical protein LH500_12405 [Lentilactobacillus hilgardii]
MLDCEPVCAPVYTAIAVINPVESDDTPTTFNQAHDMSGTVSVIQQTASCLIICLIPKSHSISQLLGNASLHKNPKHTLIVNKYVSDYNVAVETVSH